MIAVIADTLLITGALGAGMYCYVLAKRLSKFNDLENGVGGAVAVLSAQVDDLTETLKAAQDTAASSTNSLNGLTDRAESVAKRLEILVASMHDIDQGEKNVQQNAEVKIHAPQSMEPVFKRHQMDSSR